MDLLDYIDKNSSNIIKIKVVPNSQNNLFLWEMDDWCLKFKIKWVPEKWKVNKEIINFLSKELKIAKTNIKLLSWETSRNKTIKIDF